MLSDAIRQFREEVLRTPEDYRGWFSPSETEQLLARLDVWAIEARNVEERLAVFGPHAPVLPLDVSNVRIVGGSR